MSSILYWSGMLGGWIVFLVLISIPFARYEKKKKKRLYEAAFAGREPLNAQSFYERYFCDRGVPSYIVIGIRKILEDTLDADLSRLSAEDDFTQNLRFALERDSLADVEIVQQLEDEFHIKITDAEAEKTITIRDIVDLVWSKVRQANH